MNNFLLWIGGLLVAVLAALFAVPHFVDWTSYRGVFEEEASRILGRELRVAGAVNLRLLPSPYVRFEKVRLADAAGRTGEPFFRADDFTLWLSPAPLLKGAIEANKIELRRPVLKLRLNPEGGGNWQTLSLTRGTLPFVPSDVALQSVQITDGIISVDRADGQELGRIDAVSGELSVAALEGPFRFRGSFDAGGARYELKSSTTNFDTEGGLRVKAALTAAETANTSTIEVRLADIGGKPRFEGQLNGQLSLLPARLAKPSEVAPETGMAMEVRAVIAGDTAGARLSDITLAFEQNGKPQLLGGSAQADWTRGLDIKSEFTSKWLDLDAVFGEQAIAKPLEVLSRLPASLSHFVPSAGRGRASVTVDQINLGGEALSNVRLAIERGASLLRVTDLRAALPGGASVLITGVFPDPLKPANFDGDINLRGASPARLLGWLGHSGVISDGRGEAAFSLQAKLGVTGQSIAVTQATANIAATTLSGDVSYRWEGRKRLDLALDGDRIDIGAIAPRALDLYSRIRELVNVEQPSAAGGGAAAEPIGGGSKRPAVFDARTSDLTLQIRASQLIDGDQDLRDVDIDLAVLNGRLTVSRARLTSARGLDLEVEGEVADIAARSRGSLRGTIAATDPQAWTEFLELLGVADAATLSPGLRAAAPARLAWSMRLADLQDATAGGNGPAELIVDGALLGRRLSGSLKLANGLSNWRQQPLDLTLTIDRPEWAKLRALFTTVSAAVPATSGVLASDERSQLLLKASGRADQGLATFVRIDEEGLEASYAGRAVLGADSIVSAQGDLQVRVVDLARSTALFGIAVPAGLNAEAVDGTIEISLENGAIKLRPRSLDIAGSIVDGELSLVAGKERWRLDGRVAATSVNIPRAIDVVVSGKPPVSAEDVSGAPSVWRRSVFEFGTFDELDGQIEFAIGKLALTPDLKVARAVAAVEFGPGKIDIKALDGDILGARLSSRWLLGKATAGGTLNGSARISGARLELLAPAAAGASGITGLGGLSMVVSGRGLSPHGLVAALTGKGEIELTKSELAGLAPLMVRSLADEVVGGRREATIEAFEKAIEAELRATAAAPTRRLVVGTRKLGFDIGDGIVRVRGFNVETGDGRASNRTTIDLNSLKIDSEWRLEPRADGNAPVSAGAAAGTKKASTGPLPAVTIAFVGPIGHLGRLEPVISAAATVRELAVRRMERDVDELERLRRFDEGRAKAEVERQRLEVQRQKVELESRAGGRAVGGLPQDMPLAPPAPIPQGGEAGTASPAPADGVTASDAVKSPIAPGRNGLTREPRQAPQNTKLQDIFRRQGLGGN